MAIKGVERADLLWGAREIISWEVKFDLRSKVGLGVGRRVLGRGERTCKGPEAGASSAYWEKLENTSGLEL